MATTAADGALGVATTAAEGGRDAAPASLLADLRHPPRGLLARVRWIFLLASLTLLAVIAVAGAIGGAGSTPLWPLALLGPAILVAVWLYVYRRGAYSLLADALVGLALLAFAVAAAPLLVSVALTTANWMRALRGSGQGVARGILISLVALAAGAVLVPPPEPSVVVDLAARGVFITVLAVLLYLIRSVLERYELALTRERILREAGSRLLSAAGRAPIYAATIESARALLAGAPGAGVTLAVGTEERMLDVAGTDLLAGAAAVAVRTQDLPDTMRAALHEGRPAEMAHADPQLWRAFGLQPRSGTIYAVPLMGQGTFDGAIVAGSDTPFDDEVKDGLQILTGLAALALESELLLEGDPGAGPPPGATPGTAAAARAMAGPGTDGASAGQPAAPSTPPVLRPPAEPLARVRWFFLVSLGVIALIAGLRGLVGAMPSLPWIATVTAPIWLIGWWVYGYRRGALPLIGDVVIAILLVVAGLGAPSRSAISPLLAIAVFFRSLYGPRRDVVVATAIYVAALVMALVAARSLAPQSALNQLSGADVALQLVLMVVLATVSHAVGIVLRRYERAMFRERTLRVTGSTLVVAIDRATVYRTALAGAGALLSGQADAAVTLALGTAEDPGDMEVVAAAGERAARASGDHVLLATLPAALRDALGSGRPAEVPQAGEALWQALDLEPRAGSAYAIPLTARGQLEGAIVVASNAPLDEELKDDLQTHADLVALAIEGLILVEHRQN